MKTFIMFCESLVNAERAEISYENIKDSLKTIVPKDMPKEVVDLMRTWKVVTKSPYSHSYYDITNKSWDDNIADKYFRISDHWNFKTNYDNRVHCKTDKLLPKDNSFYALGEYQPKTGVYKILKVWQKTTHGEEFKHPKRIAKVLERLESHGIGYTKLKSEYLDNADKWRLEQLGFITVSAKVFGNDMMAGNFRKLAEIHHGKAVMDKIAKLFDALPEKEKAAIFKLDYPTLYFDAKNNKAKVKQQINK